MPIMALLILAGCGITPIREYHPAALPPHPAEDNVTLARAKQISKIMQPLKVRGAVIFPSAVKERFQPQNVMEALKKCGFNRVYLHITSEQEIDDQLRALVIAAHDAGLPVEVVISQQDFYRCYQVNQLIRWAIIQYPTLVDVAGEVADFNADLPENIRLAGITVHIVPQLYNSKNVRRMYRSLYSWSERSYGKGGDNDMLMQKAFADLQQIKAIENLPPLTVAVHDFFHDRAVAGDLSTGKIQDFARISPRVAVVNSANLPSQLPEKIAGELQSAAGKCTILNVIPLATHTSIDTERLRRRNWDDLMRALENCVETAWKDPDFGGVIISPYSVVEYLRLEK
jgi:hypothetical protein